jgi:hypothetical protein
MSALALGLTIILAVTTVTFYIASGMYGHGSPWARDVCSLSQELCDHPIWSALATGLSLLLYYGLHAFRY